ncbi:MAG: DUF2520 domain-containing protein [Solirubrobacteraceae bacterium]
MAIVGRGRLGTALAAGLRQAEIAVSGPLGRGAAPSGVDAVLLCVPDTEITAAAALIPAGVPVGHCSGATGLDALGSREAFSLHPLMTFASAPHPAPALTGVTAAVAGSTPTSLGLARGLAHRLGMRAVEIAEGDRAAYHAAASIASNFLVTLEWAAERVAADAGIERADLLPLVRATVENWGRLGAERALTGPVARGDGPTVARQRAAVEERSPEALALFDALVDATRRLAASAASVPAGDPVS